MAASATPNFAVTPWHSDVSLSAADTARSNPVTAVVTLKTAPATGSLCTRIWVTAMGTTTAGVVRLFISNDNGTTKRLVEEVIVPAITPSTTVPVWSGEFRKPTLTKPIILGPSTNNILYVTTNNAESFAVHAEGADFT